MRSILDMKKKGQVGDLAPAIISLVLAGVILVLGLVIGQELRDTQTSGTDAFVAANDTVIGLATFADFWEIIVIAIVVTVVIGLLLAGFGRRAR